MVWEYRVFLRVPHGGAVTAALRAALGLDEAPAAASGCVRGAPVEARTDWYLAGTGAAIGIKARGGKEGKDGAEPLASPRSPASAAAASPPPGGDSPRGALLPAFAAAAGEPTYELKFLRSAYEGAVSAAASSRRPAAARVNAPATPPRRHAPTAQAELGKVEITVPSAREWLSLQAKGSASARAAAALALAPLEQAAAAVGDAPLAAALEKLVRGGAMLGVRKRRWKGAAGEVTEVALVDGDGGALPGTESVTFCCETSRKDGAGLANVAGSALIAGLRAKALMPEDERVLIASYSGWVSLQKPDAGSAKKAKA